MADQARELLTQFLMGANPVPGSDVDINSIAPMNQQQPKPPGFFKQMLSGFITNLAGGLQEGSFQKAVAQGIATRKRGSTSSDAFAASMGGFQQERQNVEQRTAHNRIQEMKVRLEKEQAQVEVDRQKLARERELRLASAQQQQIAAGLAKAGLRTKVDPVTGESSLEPIPEEELPVHEREKLKSNRSLQEYRTLRLDMDRLRLDMANERNEFARGNLQARMGELRTKQMRLEAELFGTVSGTPIPGGPTTAEGQPMGTRTFSAMKRAPETVKQEENAADGLRALDDIEKELGKTVGPGGEVTFTAAGEKLPLLSLPFSPGARVLRNARDAAVDVITRLRTGAALNMNEEKFYANQVPTLADLTEPRAIQVKLDRLRALYEAFQNGRIRKGGDATRLFGLPVSSVPAEQPTGNVPPTWKRIQ